MPLILETIVTTLAPTRRDASRALRTDPGRGGPDPGALPAVAHDPNLEASPFFAASSPRDVRVIAGCVTGRRDWPVVPCDRIRGRRLADSFAHAEFEIVDIEDDDTVRPRYRGRIVHRRATRPSSATTGPRRRCWRRRSCRRAFTCWNREKILSEMRYLAIAISKTAGPREREAWDWIEDKVAAALGRDDRILANPDAA